MLTSQDIARYIPGTLKLVFQGMLQDIDLKEQPTHSLYREMENLDFQIMLTNKYYTNPNSMRICFLLKIKQKSDNDSDLVTVNNFFAHFVK